jgi:hypothetical protein
VIIAKNLLRRISAGRVRPAFARKRATLIAGLETQIENQEAENL